MTNVLGETPSIAQTSVKSFGKKSVFLIAISSFLVGSLTTLITLKALSSSLAPSLVKIPPEESVPKATPTPPAGEAPEPVKKILAGVFSSISETKASPGVLSVNKANVVRIFDPETEQTVSLPIEAICCGGSLFMGNSEPLLSSTHQRIAYINKSDNNIWLIDSNGENNIKISTQGLKETEESWGTRLSISGWSGDERWLVYHVNIADEGMGINPEDKLQPPVIEGFYAADLEAGKIYLLPNLPNFVEFLPQSNLIVFVKETRKPEGGIEKTDLYTYDFEAVKIERLTQESIEGSVSQFSFAQDKKHFAYVKGRPMGDSFSMLVYASQDNINKKEITKGQWAEVQFPHISPDGRYLAYERYMPATCPGGGGCPQARLVIYDLETNHEKNLGPIKKTLYLYDNNRIIVLGGEYIGPWSLQIADRVTGSVKTIAEDEALRNQ